MRNTFIPVYNRHTHSNHTKCKQRRKTPNFEWIAGAHHKNESKMQKRIQLIRFDQTFATSECKNHEKRQILQLFHDNFSRF